VPNGARFPAEPLDTAFVSLRLKTITPRNRANKCSITRAYAGLRPREAFGLRWGDVREQTLLIQRAISLGEESDTKTRQHRTVPLLAPLAADLQSWRVAVGRPGDRELVFPGKEAQPWTQAAYQSWRRRAFKRGTEAAGLALRHSFASLLLHEGRSVIYVARQLGHDARLTLTRYGT
jgi:integrase